MTRTRWTVAGVALALFLLNVRTFTQDADQFQKRRQAVREAMAPDSVLIVRNTPSVDDMGSSRSDPNFGYLTGLGSEGTALVLFAATFAPPAGFPAGMTFRMPTEILFRTAPASASGAGPGAEALPAARGFAAGTVRRSSEFQATFDNLLLTSQTLYLDYRRSRALNGPLTADEQLLKQARDRGASVAIKPASSLLAPLRVIKSAGEIDLLRHAADITAAAEREAMRAARPGLFEYQLQSIIEHVFTINGARRPGFSTIVGSGPNSCILHWSENTRQTQPGDVVVLDIGAEFQNYTADITRTIPVNGTFSKRQRDIYAIVLQANEQAIGMLKPGASMRDVSAKVQDVLGDGLLKLGVVKDKTQTFRYSLHGPSHPIGLQVHDVGSTAVLQPGMVITIEPGLYLPDEQLGIRIEDDVLITPGGHEVITGGAPKAIEEIEALMKQGGGIDFRRYLIGRITS